MSREPKYSFVDPKNGNVTYNGPLEIVKGNHDGMTPRTEAYLPGDEKGHVCASSLSPYAVNSSLNIVPQNGSDINHGAWLHTEMGERNALSDGASIHSEKTAYVDGHVGDRPHTFTVNDHVFYADGHHVEELHFSFPNEAYADQAAFNDLSASLPGTFDGSANPGDVLRAEMNEEQYAELMESSDALLPGLTEEYAAADYSGLPPSADIHPDFGAESTNAETAAEFSVTDDGLAVDCDNN